MASDEHAAPRDLADGRVSLRRAGRCVYVTNRCLLRPGSSSGPDVRDGDPGRVAGQQFHVGWVHRGDHRPAEKVGDRHDEGVDGAAGAGTGAAEDLAGPNTGTGVNRMHLHSLAAKAGEHRGVARVAPDDLGPHGRNGSHRELSTSHLGYEGPHPVPPGRWAVRHG